MAQAVEYFKCKEGRICPPSEKYIHFDLDTSMDDDASAVLLRVINRNISFIRMLISSHNT